MRTMTKPDARFILIHRSDDRGAHRSAKLRPIRHGRRSDRSHTTIDGENLARNMLAGVGGKQQGSTL